METTSSFFSGAASFSVGFGFLAAAALSAAALSAALLSAAAFSAAAILAASLRASSISRRIMAAMAFF